MRRFTAASQPYWILEERDKLYVTKDTPPFLILHGDHDPLVPVNQSELLYEALIKAGVPVTFHKLVGAGDGGPAFNSPVVRAMVLAFFDQHLRMIK